MNQALGLSSAANDLNNDGVVNVADIQIVIVSVLGEGCAPDNSGGSPLVISGFSPFFGPAGTLVTVQGSNFGVSPQVSMPAQAGGAISVPLASVTATSVSFVIPAGAATGPITVANGGVGASTSSAFTVTPASSFTMTVTPASATLIQGQSVAYSVQATSTNGFDQLAHLSVSSLPAGVTAAFAPPSVASGGTSILTLTAPANQAVAVTNLSINAAATVQGLPVTQSSPVSLAVVAPTTSLIGRTVVSNPQEAPLAGVTVSSLGLSGTVGSGGAPQTTGCTGFTTVSDAAGNFALTNLPQACTGTQLFEFNGTTATSPAGQYAGVNLVFTLTLGQVTPSPVLVHLPRIDNVETFNVQQNAAANQTYNFTTIPGLSVTVYAGTTLTAPDGSTPNPFPLSGVQVPVDRLPDMKPNVPTMVRVFIVAFQPAESTASQPVAITFPNVSNTAPGTDMPLMTLNPQYGQMVPYGTGAVSANGAQVVPDADPAHPGHLYGLVHFDWHGQMPPPANQLNPCPLCMAAQAGDPVDLSSGLQVLSSTDVSIAGARGSLGIERVYRSLSTYNGAFGPGHEIQFAWQLNTGAPNNAASIELISPDGNQYLFGRQSNGTLTNATMPDFQGAVMTTNSSGATSLRFADGTVYQFQAFAGVSYLASVTDRAGNTTTFTVTPLNATTLRITKITDPVGRSLNLTYNSATNVTSVTDPIGRTVTYTYNSSGTLATFTDANGGVTRYQYDSQNRMNGMIDPRGVQMFQDTFDANGHVLTQTRPDGGVFQFAYIFANSLVATSPVISTVVTDPLGNQTTYRFNIQGILTDVTDALGQMKSFTLSAGTNLVTSVSGSAQCDICGPPGQGNMSFTYDANGNILTVTDALGNSYTRTYDPVFNQITSYTDPLGHVSTFTYDASGNLITGTDADGNVTQFAYTTGGLVSQITDPLGNVTMIGRDSLGNPTSVTDPLGNVSTSSYDAVSRPVGGTDPLGRHGTSTYDPLDRIVSRTNGKGNRTLLSYDPAGNLLSVRDARGNITSYAYDSLSRAVSRTTPLGTSETYQYDLDGNLTQHTDRRGQVGSLQYDALDRLIREQFQDGSSVTWTYDPYSRPLTVTDSLSGMFAFSYDANGGLISQNEPNGTVQYTRDALGRVASRQVAGEPVVTYSYDAAGNLLGASSTSAGITYSYDRRNLPVSFERTNGVTTSYGYDANDRVLSIIHARGATAINTQTYAYDGSGKRIGASNDLAQPLIAQSAASTVDEANELLSNGQTTYTNDANGNRLTASTASGTTSFVWDSRNRLTSIADASGNLTTFKYDFGNQLIEIDKTSGGVTTVQKFVLDDLTNTASLTDAAGLPVSVLTGRTIDSHYASVDSAGIVSFGIEDALGSIGGVVNGAGALTANAAFDPYGQTGSTPPLTFPFGYTGRLPVAGNIAYLRTRFLDTATGRFLSEDPADFGGGDVNLYGYSSEDPIDFNDPAGLAPQYPFPDPTWSQVLGDYASSKLSALGDGIDDAAWAVVNNQNLLDFLVGAEDDVTLGISTWALRQLGYGDRFRTCSSAFAYGQAAALFLDAGLRAVRAGGSRIFKLTQFKNGKFFGGIRGSSKKTTIAYMGATVVYNIARIDRDIATALNKIEGTWAH
jgi:RHS repeat-associated protein